VEIPVIGPGTHHATFKSGREAGPLDPNYLGREGRFHFHDYWLEPFDAPTKLIIEMTSEDFESEVYIMQPPLQQPIWWSPMSFDGNLEAHLEVTLEAGQPYVIRATTQRERIYGDYTLKITLP